MSKYINAEEFNTYKFEHAVIQYANACGELCQIPLRKFIKSLPSADVVKVGRCQDCGYFDEENTCHLGDEYGFCENMCVYLKKTGFCSDFERR